jgi:hypothetical protein
MEKVKHHVTASGNSGLRGFFSSDAVDFDPPSLSLRHNIKKAKAKAVYDLADGATGDDEENAIKDLMVTSENSYELIRMIGAVGGWAGLDDELPEAHLDPIARQLAQVLDQRDYDVYKLIRRHLILLDYNASPNLGDCFLKILRWPPPFQPPEFDAILDPAFRAKLLKGIASATLRHRDNMVNAARIHAVDVIAVYDAAAPHREDELVRLMHQVNYTTRICTSLEMLRYHDLYNVILDMADPTIADVRQRQACHDAVKELNLEFAAAEGAVKYAGTVEAQSTVGRFMLARKAALDTFTGTVPPATIVTAIATAINATTASLNGLRDFIFQVPNLLTSSLTLASFTGSNQDDNARNFINQASSQNWLAQVPASIKTQAINACLGGGDLIPAVDDDDEIAINKVLEAAKASDQAELYQLAAAATWEALYSSFNGDEYDQLEDILGQPV